MICRGYIRAYKGVFQIFLQFYSKIYIEVKFLTFVFISGQIWKGLNGLGGQKSYQRSI